MPEDPNVKKWKKKAEEMGVEPDEYMEGIRKGGEKDSSLFVEDGKEFDKTITRLQDKMFLDFMDFLGNQDKLMQVEDMVPGLNYGWNHSPDGTSHGRALLWEGVPTLWWLEEKEDLDAQINIEVRMLNVGCTYAEIWVHKKGEPLLKGWRKEIKRGGENGNGGLEKTGQEGGAGNGD